MQVSLGGPLSSNSTKLDGKAPSCPFFFPSHQPSSIWGGGGRRAIWFCPKGFSRTLPPLFLPRFRPRRPSSLAPSLSHLCVPHHPQGLHPLFTHPSLRPKPLITSSPHLLYHFHNLPSLQLQLVCLLRAVVEVHLAPSLGAPRFGGATWGQTRETEAAGAVRPQSAELGQRGAGSAPAAAPGPALRRSIVPKNQSQTAECPSGPTQSRARHGLRGAAGATQARRARPPAWRSPRRRAQRGLGASPAPHRDSGISWK